MFAVVRGFPRGILAGPVLAFCRCHLRPAERKRRLIAGGFNFQKKGDIRNSRVYFAPNDP